MSPCSLLVLCLCGVLHGARREPRKFHGLRSITELAGAAGYRATNIEVVTEDGYSLWLHRLGNNSGAPVLVQHGILLAADSWITRPRKDLVYLLLAKGYDVWLSNLRGTVYNEYNLHYPKSDPKYWDFSFHESGYYDLPASIDAVLERSGMDQLFYIAHSLGTTAFLVMCSTRPQYNAKIRTAALLSPVAYSPPFSELNPVLRALTQTASTTYEALQLLGLYQVGFRTDSKILTLRALCSQYSLAQSLCLDVLGLFIGEHRENLNKNDFNNFIPYASAGTSIKTLYHLAQGFQSGEFKQFDYGAQSNTLMYRSRTKPPAYRLELVTAPVALFWGRNDNFLSESTIKKLSSVIPNVIYNDSVADPKFSHLDMILGDNTQEVLYPFIIEILESFVN